MRFSLLSAAIVALAASVSAQEATPFFDVITAPTEGEKVVAGKTFAIKWLPGTEPEYLNGTATIVLLQGSTTKDLQVGPTIVAGVKNSAGSYSWDVPTDIKYTLYGLRITLDSDKTILQYSFPFQITSTAQSGTVTVTVGTGTGYISSSTSTSATFANSTTSTTSSSASATTSKSSSATLTSASTTVAAASSSTTPSPKATNSAATYRMSGVLAVVCGLALAFTL